MKGIIFTEFLDLVDSTFGIEVTEAILERAQVASGGAYTQVGDYGHGEMVQLVVALAEEVKVPIEQLLMLYGKALFARLVAIHKVDMSQYNSAFGFLLRVEDDIHRQVRKLYDKATPPTFLFDEIGEQRMVLRYMSHRGFGAVAHGLILGCAAYYGEDLVIERTALNESGTEVRFVLERQ
ncbi:heme NO-binding domain-containing protein [Ferrimonas pelagia]|uniref:Nitric oxide sensor HnoX n=1 Tax=Ferrimonas pelagia TaxID=1177826 RepID=A0ABP9EIR2_9GAMM